MNDAVQEMKNQLTDLIAERISLSEQLGPLLRKRDMLESEIKFKESEAFLGCEFEGKTQIGVVNDKAVALTNDRMRDAFKRLSSAELRAQRGEVLGVIAELNEKITKITTVITAIGHQVELEKIMLSRSIV